MKPVLAPAALTLGVLSAIALAGCSGATTATPTSSSADGRPRVVASTDVWGSVVSQLAGNDATVTSIITNPDADPHEYEADARVQLKLSKADIVVQNGGGYDDFVGKMLKSAHVAPTVIDAVTTSGVKDDPVLGDLNEHVWYDFDAVRAVAESIERALAKKAPAHAGAYAANLTAFESRLDGLIAEEKTIAASAAGRGAAITEPVPLYMLEASGLVDKTPPAFSKAIEDDTDVPATVLQDTLALFSEHQVALLAYNEQTTGPQTEAVLKAAKDAGIPVVPVTETLPKGKTYLSWMQSTLTAIGAAVGVAVGG